VVTPVLEHVRRSAPLLRLRAYRARQRLKLPHRVRRALAVVAVGLIGAWLGLLAGGRTSTPVGPVDTHMTAHLSWHGDTLVRVGPLGTLKMDTHDGPIGITVSVDQLRVADARQLFENPTALEGLETWIGRDVTDAIRGLVIRSVASAALGGVLLGVLVFHRQFRRITFVGATALATVVGSVGAAGATWSPRAIAEPEFTGLLTSAPSVVGNAQNIVASFSNYSQELAKLVTNVSKLYDVTSTLPAYEPAPNTIRILHVSDIHLNPAAWDVIRSIAEQFQAQAIVDSGDISDHGTKAERRFLNPIRTLKLPYVWVRGNHDSADTQAAIAAMPNAVVLDHGQIKQVAGLRFIGTGDPRFTPDRSVEAAGADIVAATGLRLAKVAKAAKVRPDVAVVHDPHMAEQMDGAVPLVLAGHGHERETRLLPLGTRLFEQGSTGGAGLRALEGEEPTPIECTVFYFDAGTRRLQAWDDITLGGLGLASAQISRSLAPEEQALLAQTKQGTPRPQPKISAPKKATATPAPVTKPESAAVVRDEKPQLARPE
jgi:predicted MPP superfamily phosphohydrolase